MAAGTPEFELLREFPAYHRSLKFIRRNAGLQTGPSTRNSNRAQGAGLATGVTS
jgi:hypothetical protein